MAFTSAHFARQVPLTSAFALSSRCRTPCAFPLRGRHAAPQGHGCSSCLFSASAAPAPKHDDLQGDAGESREHRRRHKAAGDAENERGDEAREGHGQSPRCVSPSGGYADKPCPRTAQADGAPSHVAQGRCPKSCREKTCRSGEESYSSFNYFGSSTMRSSVSLMHRGYRFDRMLDSRDTDPEAVAYLDKLAMTGLKTLEVPHDVKTKLEVLLKQVGQKRDLENVGRFMMAKLTARTSVELPRVLPSRLLHDPPREDKGDLSPNQRGCVSLEGAAGETPRKGETDTTSCSVEPPAEQDQQARAAESQLDQEALALAEDRRHRLFRKFMGSHSPVSAAAYTAHRYAGVYASMVRILSEIKLRAPDFRPKRVMEVQAGFAAGLMAAYQIWSPGHDVGREALWNGSGDDDDAPSLRRKGDVDAEPREGGRAGSGDIEEGFEYLLAVERSAHLANVGKYLTAEFTPRVQWQLGLYEEGTASCVEEAGHNVGQRRRLDLVIMPHCLLSSVDGQESRHMLVRNLWNRLSHGGILVLVERGTPTGFRSIHAVRELFIKELGVGRFHFLAPCPHESICPLALTGRDWCHFAQRVRRLPHYLYCKGSRSKNVEEDKFSYLVVRKMQGPRRKFSCESECTTLEEQSHFWPRVVMPVIKAGQHCLLDVCARPHTFERVAVSKGMPHGAGYKFARKAAWGDLWRFPRRVVRPEARGYTSEEMQQHLLRLASKNRANEARGREGSEQVGSREERDRLEDEFVKFFGN